jgi:asparagine synthase (glutamine-hydrolysing)
MSAVVGVFWRTLSGEKAALEAFASLAREISSTADAKSLTETRLRNCVLLKFDFGAYGSPGLASADGAVSAICGHPYVAHLRGAPRSSHLRFLAAAAHESRFTDFAQARGSFSFACAEEGRSLLTLAVDCLGTRPLYCADDGVVVVFSSTLAPFRRLAGNVTGGRDERAAVETAVFGFPLADRTEWRQVRCVPPGSALVFGDGATKHIQYWSMSTVRQAAAASQAEALEAVFDTFRDAVALRAAGGSSVMAHLSGGMDSRAVVAMLRSLDIEVNSLNLGAPESQDLIYGRKIAAALGCSHTEVPTEADSVQVGVRSAQLKWLAKLEREKRGVERPHLVWSGDGGSVTLGHVYLTEEMVGAAESSHDERAIEVMLAERSWTVPKRVLRRERIDEIVTYPKAGLLEALSEQSSSDPGRRLHMMLMATDQRRHLHPHYEHIYEHRCELQVPFFDKNFVEAVIGRPVRPFLYHRFYNEWFERFPKVVMSVPWQAYPGHEACPVAATEDLTYQWTKRSQMPMHRRERRQYLARTGRALLGGAFSRTSVSARRVAVAWAATALGIRDLTYALRFSSILANQ